MPRVGWLNLSAAYRKRLQRGGITRSAYESGASLRAARGHAATPEHYGQGRNRPEFQRYYQEYHVQWVPVGQIHSDEVKARLAERLTQIFGDRDTFKEVRDPDWPPVDHPPAPDDDTITAMLDMDDDGYIEWMAQLAALDYEPEYWFLWYH